VRITTIIIIKHESKFISKSFDIILFLSCLLFCLSLCFTILHYILTSNTLLFIIHIYITLTMEQFFGVLLELVSLLCLLSSFFLFVLCENNCSRQNTCIISFFFQYTRTFSLINQSRSFLFYIE